MTEETNRNELPPVMLGMVSVGTPVTRKAKSEEEVVSAPSSVVSEPEEPAAELVPLDEPLPDFQNYFGSWDDGLDESGADDVDGQAGEKDATEAAAKRPNVKQRRGRKKKKINPLFWVILAVLALAIVLTSGYIGWDRWMRYDDASDIQGKWMAVGAKKSVTIKEDSIKLNKEVTYSYSMDTQNKTLTLTFGQKSGLSRYRFSMDRTQLAIMDCQEISALDALMDDLAWQLSCVFASITGGEQPSLAAGAKEAAIVLLRPEDAKAQAEEQESASGDDLKDADSEKKDSTESDDGSKDGSKSDGSKDKDSGQHYESEPSTSDTGSLLDGFDVTDKPLPNELNYTGNDWL